MKRWNLDGLRESAQARSERGGSARAPRRRSKESRATCKHCGLSFWPGGTLVPACRARDGGAGCEVDHAHV
jgi:hypothetical protein